MMEEVNKVVNILRAKDKKKSKIYLLKDHMVETLKRLEEYHKYVESNKEAIKYRFNDDFFGSLTKALFIHDLGKIDYNFQRKVFNYEEIRCADGEWRTLSDFFKYQKEMKNIRHEILSSLWSTFMLGKENTEWNKKIRTAILLHHYNDYYLNEKDLMEIISDYRRDIEKYLKFISEKKKELSEVIKALITDVSNSKEITSDLIKQTLNEIQENINFDFLSELLKRVKAHDDDISKIAEFYEIDNENIDYNFLIFLGVIRRCDYSASGGVSIEKIKGSINEVFKDIDKKIKEKIKIQEAEELWQNRILEKYKNNKNLILIAPTGSGKTEFALLWAKEMKRKLIYTLPLRVALNDLFIRFRGEEKGYFDRGDFVGILHSTSFIEYINEKRAGKEIDIEHQIHSSEMFSFPIILTTPDQVFLTSLNFYGSDKLISLYPISSVVIDEVQTYDEEMAAITLKTLEIINELGGNTLIITATFPPYLKKFLDEKYTIIDVTNDEIKDYVKNYKLKRHKLHLIKHSIFKKVKSNNNQTDKSKEKWIIKNESKEFIKDTIKNNKDDKNILIVVNNVPKAIDIFKMFLENKEEGFEVNQENIYLLHSRLIEKEKTKRIKEIKDKLKNKEKGIIVVATQIVEVSVDIDFDILITEISTIDSQIQRWGRIYRNREEDYNGEEANVNIFVGEETKGAYEIDEGTTSIYDKKVIEKTIEVLKKYEKKGALDYKEERKMIERTFDEHEIDGKTLRKIYEDKIEKILGSLKYFTVEKKSEAQRLFRNIAGTQVVIPQLIEENEHKRFAEIIENHKKTEDLPWDKIIKKIYDIKEDASGEYQKKINEKKRELIKALYEHSVNVPQYYIERYPHIISHKFKGFNVLKTDISKETVENIKKYGIDEYLKNIEEELMVEENII